MPFSPWSRLEREGAYPPPPGRDEAIIKAAQKHAEKCATVKAANDIKSAKRKRK